ncbi:MAG TPA: aldose epimerase family protein [Acidimicrobiales bacterium]|nr:aldose epimerase family protein [Acidimicrobiales bacterium]
MPSASSSLSVSEQAEGEVGGAPVRRFALTNANGMRAEILNYGGIIASLEFPDRAGTRANVVLGYATLGEWVHYNAAPTAYNPKGQGPYMGAIIGRVANRLGGGRFRLNGVPYQVAVNHPQDNNSLHGGDVGFDQRVWSATAEQDDASVGVRLDYVSPAGEMGFPGRLTTTAIYTLDGDNRLSLRLRATTDELTIVNLTNHTYWDLNGEGAGTIYDHLLQLNADHYTPVGEHLLPTGEILPVAGSPLDFRQLHPIGERIRESHPQLLAGHGYDHNWVVNQTSPRSLVLAATVISPASGRRLDVYTTQPGCQFYSGNFLNGTVVGSGGRAYRQSDGFALETQHFPNAPSCPGFPSIELAPGQVYDETIVFRLSCEG